MIKGSNTNTIKSQNYSLILNCLRKTPMSRAQISKLTSLSKSAVTMLTKQLIDEGQLTEIGTTSTDFGRHPILLDIVKGHRFALGVNLTRKLVSVCLVNLKLEIIDMISSEISHFSSAVEVIDWCCENGFKLIEKNNLQKDSCIGIGVASPGPLDYKTKTVLNPPNFPILKGVNIAELFEKHTNLPVFLNNGPVLMAIYEHTKRKEKIENYLYVTVDNGIGSAIIQKGKVYRGSGGFSGEIGHTTVDINGPLCDCGNNGCLEGYATKKAIESRFGNSFESMTDLAYNNDQKAVLEVEKTARLLSAGIINAVNLLDVDAVIIHGELNYRYEMLFSEIQHNINNRSIISRAHGVTVLPSIITESYDVAFSAATVIEKYFNQEI